MRQETLNVTVPVNTSEYNPLKKTIYLAERYLVKIEVSMDTVATKGRVGVKFAGGRDDCFRWPATPTEWIRKSDTWVGKVDLGDWYTKMDILFTSEKDGISCQYPHLVVITIQTSNI